jgi:hypothetical protein
MSNGIEREHHQGFILDYYDAGWSGADLQLFVMHLELNLPNCFPVTYIFSNDGVHRVRNGIAHQMDTDEVGVPIWGF